MATTRPHSKFLTVVWTVAVVLIFALQWAAMAVSHDTREVLYFAAFVTGAAAFGISMIYNKSRYGACFPRAKRNRQD